MNDLMNEVGASKSRARTSNSVAEWISDNGEDLICSLEVERPELVTPPVRSVSAHAFVIDGWVEMDRSADIKVALAMFAVVDVEPFVIQQAVIGHDDEHREPDALAYQLVNNQINGISYRYGRATKIWKT